MAIYNGDMPYEVVVRTKQGRYMKYSILLRRLFSHALVYTYHAVNLRTRTLSSHLRTMLAPIHPIHPIYPSSSYTIDRACIFIYVYSSMYTHLLNLLNLLISLSPAHLANPRTNTLFELLNTVDSLPSNGNNKRLNGNNRGRERCQAPPLSPLSTLSSALSSLRLVFLSALSPLSPLRPPSLRSVRSVLFGPTSLSLPTPLTRSPSPPPLWSNPALPALLLPPPSILHPH